MAGKRPVFKIPWNEFGDCEELISKALHSYEMDKTPRVEEIKMS